MSRDHVGLCSVQTGPLSSDIDKNIEHDLRLLKLACSKKDLDYVLYPELATTPFWPIGLEGKQYFDWAEQVPGKVTRRFSKAAREYGVHVVLPIFEKGKVEGQYYNSAAVISPSGDLVQGVLPSGKKVYTARKNYISQYSWESGSNNEKLFFTPGPGHPIFQTKLGAIGVLICYERWFTEAWRLLALSGAVIVFVPNASSGYVQHIFLPLIRASAAQNGVFCVASNKGGTERVDGRSARYFGLSCIVDPAGRVLTTAPKFGADKVVSADVDLREVERQRRSLFIFRDRRPELYKTILEG